MTFPDDPVITNVSGYALPRTSWALVKDGIIAGISRTYDHVKPPFPDVPVARPGSIPLTGTVAIIVTNTQAVAGHLVDHHGNTTPSEGRIGPLSEGQAAYHDGAAHRVQPGAVIETTPEDEPEQTEGDDNGETHDDAAE
ncbi:hypothetical protein [Gluconobacter oxydans]|uniref:Uncharacterized protein n=1 Tax=Gluconobacter oxydans (strain 621H) TaxID=290633 RepID=Q5FN65_GLUOX|nr:hypothetical protein [Gluconobacter oxydans]AAW62182.1 Hypothetical protein GOX2451 [Gluconobacter oxydans 621H]